MSMKDDHELRNSSLIIGIFTVALLIIYFTYSNLPGILEGSFWLAALWLVVNAIIVAGWYIVVKHWQDPQVTLYRAILIVAHVVAIAITMGHRAGWLEQVK